MAELTLWERFGVIYTHRYNFTFLQWPLRCSYQSVDTYKTHTIWRTLQFNSKLYCLNFYNNVIRSIFSCIIFSKNKRHHYILPYQHFSHHKTSDIKMSTCRNCQKLDWLFYIFFSKTVSKWHSSVNVRPEPTVLINSIKPDQILNSKALYYSKFETTNNCITIIWTTRSVKANPEGQQTV